MLVVKFLYVYDILIFSFEKVQKVVVRQNWGMLTKILELSSGQKWLNLHKSSVTKRKKRVLIYFKVRNAANAAGRLIYWQWQLVILSDFVWLY